VEAVSRKPEPLCRRMAQIAERLKEKRERADYQSSPFIRIDEEVPVLLDDAREFKTLLESLPQRHPRPQSVRR
jgi:hypothetical protein